MRTLIRAVLCVAICGVLSSSAWAQKAKDDKPGSTEMPSLSGSADPVVARAEKELLQADREFMADVQKNGLDGWVRWFAEQGVEDTGGIPSVGQEAIRKTMADHFAPDVHVTWEPQGARAFETGTMGLTWGQFQWTFKNKDGKPEKVGGQYITVWKKQKDGNWRVIWDGGQAKH